MKSSRRSPCFVGKACRLYKNGQLTNLILLLSLFLVVVVAVRNRMKIAGSPAKNQSYQVFLTFRGEQLRNNVMSHLIAELGRNEINFFVDKNEQRGKHLRDLFARIKESKIALVIFSTRYPESKWCMDELVDIVKRADKGELVLIPIFYKVTPEVVKNLTLDSEFGRNFWKLAQVSSGDQNKKWKEALGSSVNYTGLYFGYESSEADFIREVAKEVKIVIENLTQGRRKSFRKFLS